MKRTLVFFFAISALFAAFLQESPIRDGSTSNGIFDALVKVYDSPSGGNLLYSGNAEGLRIVNGYVHNIDDFVSGYSGWVVIEIDGRALYDGRIEYMAPRTSLRREGGGGPVILETMDDELQIGQPGDELYVASDVTGFGNDAPDERVVVDGKLSLSEGTGPTPTTGYGKVYVKSDDGHLYYMGDDSTEVDLTVDANAVQSVSSSVNTTGRTAHMRYIPGESTEIMESATDDTIFIQHNVNVTGSGGSTPCSDPPSAPSTVVGPTTVCEMATGVAYAVPPVSGANFYFWELPSESYIVSGSGTNSVVVNFGSSDGNIAVYASNDCGTSASPATISITMTHPPLMPGSITGPSAICESATESYSISAVTGASSYTWTLPSGAFISSGYGTNSVNITFASSSGTVCVTADNSCGSSEPQCMPVTVFGSLSGVLPGAITGSSAVCSGGTDISYSISEMPDATSYSWTVPAEASIVSGSGTNSILVDFGTSSGNVSVIASNSCGSSDSRVLAVTVSPNSVGGSISGTSSICLGSDTGTMSLSGNVGAVTKWQKSRDGGGWVDISRTEITYSETPSLAGAWEYRAEVRSGACAAVYSASHTVNVSPTSVGGEVSGGSSPICLGSSTGTLNLSGYTGSVVRWQRSSDDGSTWSNISHVATSYSETPPSTGTWQYRAVVQSSPCSEAFSLARSIEVSPTTVPGSVTGGTTPICIGSATGTLTLSGHTGDIIKWQRSTDGGATWADISNTATTYSETPVSYGSYTYRAVVQSGACSQQSSGSVTIVVSPATVAGSVTGGTSPICLGNSTGTLILSGHTGDINRWQRSTDGGSTWTDISHTTASFSETPGTDGTYYYRAVVQSGACSELFSTPSSGIVVNPVPTSEFTASATTVPTGFSVDFEAVESGATYSWSFPGGTPSTSTSPTPTVSWSSTGSYTVSYSVTKGGCTTDRDTTITVRSPLTQTFAYTGSAQSFTVPTGVGVVKIECWGAQGGSGANGGYATGKMAVSSGDVLNVYVGGTNGYNGGGNGTASNRNGGGMSDVRVGGTAIADQVIVAGGGGGGGDNTPAGAGGGGTSCTDGRGGGGGHGYSSSDGAAGTCTTGGLGGPGSAGGGGGGGGGLTSGGGEGRCTYGSYYWGTAGTRGQGGSWIRHNCSTCQGGGGGGGYYGGGGAATGCCSGGSGGGGSCWASPTLTERSFSGGTRSGNGQVTITY